MRQILFKAKRVDNVEWVEGDLVHSVYKINDVCVGKYGSEIGMHQIDPETICQYTGLTDKNGNKIWENDVVSHTYTTYEDDKNSYPPFRSEQKKKNYVIKWDSTAVYCGYRYHNGRNIFPFKKGTVINGDDEVIGNLFDNADLLKGE